MAKKDCKDCKEFEGKYYDEVIAHCDAVIESGVYLRRIGDLQAALAKAKKERFEILKEKLK